MSRELHDKLVEAGINPDRVLQSTTKNIMGKFNERFHPTDSIGYAYGIITTRTTFTSMSHFARAPREARMSDAARPGIQHRDTRTR